MRTVAALYVERGGPYFTMPGVDPWDVDRDARTYAGPHPVVAHPPCGSWGRFRNLASGKDRDCAPRAVDQTRAHGGVLEHPVGSTLWAFSGLPRPGEPTDAFGGFTFEVDQCAWGHVARKSTWVYAVRVDWMAVLRGVRFGGVPTHVVERTRRGDAGDQPHRLKLCSHQQRRRTPPLFAAWLVELARSAHPRSSAA